MALAPDLIKWRQKWVMRESHGGQILRQIFFLNISIHNKIYIIKFFSYFHIINKLYIFFYYHEYIYLKHCVEVIYMCNFVLTLSRPRVVTTTPTGVIKKILICPSVMIIESRPQPIYILWYLPTNFLYSSSSFLHASDSDRPS